MVLKISGIYACNCVNIGAEVGKKVLLESYIGWRWWTESQSVMMPYIMLHDKSANGIVST
jgi:hypothetical protein